jgi:peroxiredoxin
MKLAFAIMLLFVASMSAFSQNEDRYSFTAQDMDGKKVDTGALRGKIVVYSLWFVGCPNCLEEIGSLNKRVDEYRAHPDVVFLAPASSKKAEVESFLAKHPFKYRVLPNAQMLILTRFGTVDKSGEINIAFPMHYVIDRQGKAVLNVQGNKGVDAVRQELKRQLLPKAAE